MNWFKFYGSEYLSDPKMLALSPAHRSCWLTLLCYASMSEDGVVRHLTEEQLMTQAGLDFMREEWKETLGVLDRFASLGMIRNDNGVITVSNWDKRQNSNLTGYERVKRYREKKRNDNGKITLDKIRVDKNREERDFDQFWEIYPRKTAKQSALRAWEKLRPSEDLVGKILASVRAWSSSDQWTDSAGRFIPHPATFLNGSRWEDVPPRPKAARSVDLR